MIVLSMRVVYRKFEVEHEDKEALGRGEEIVVEEEEREEASQTA